MRKNGQRASSTESLRPDEYGLAAEDFLVSVARERVFVRFCIRSQAAFVCAGWVFVLPSAKETLEQRRTLSSVRGEPGGQAVCVCVRIAKILSLQLLRFLFRYVHPRGKAKNTRKVPGGIAYL